MHDKDKLTKFVALRANGWSITRISRELNIPKSTIWDWDCKEAAIIHFVKYLQLEKLQEKFLPTYENELQQLTSYLTRVEEALKAQDFSKMTPEFLLQTALQLRTRLNKMREQMPLRTTASDQPVEPLPFTGCVSNGDVLATVREDFSTENEAAAQKTEAATPSNGSPNPASAMADAADPNSSAAGPGPSSTSEGRVTTSPKPTIQVPPLPTSGNHANGNGKPHHNGHMGRAPSNSVPDSTIQRFND